MVLVDIFISKNNSFFLGKDSINENFMLFSILLGTGGGGGLTEFHNFFLRETQG